MADIIDGSAARPRRRSDPARTLETLTTLISVAFAVAALYLARDVLVPIVIAVLASFVLSQPIMALRRLGLNKVAAIAAVVFAALVIAAAVSAALTQQVSEFAVDAPKYQQTINAKVGNLRNFLSNGLVEKASAR